MSESQSCDFDREFDAGEMGCGELVYKLWFLLNDMKAGQTIKVTALDRGAPQDMPAWCELTGHQLVRAEHPEYLIRRKADETTS